MKKNSVFVRSTMTFICGYILYFAIFVGFDVSSKYGRDWKHWVASATTYSQMGEILLRDSAIYDLDDRLAIAMANNEIHFYAIRNNGEDVVYANQSGTKDAMALIAQPGIYTEAEYRYVVTQVGNFQLTIGHKTSIANYIKIYAIYSAADVARDFVIQVLGLIALLLFSFRDLRQILKRMTQRGATRGDLALAKSSETLTLVRGLQGFESQAKSLKDEKETFRSQVLPALRRELESGKKPPYEFACTLVRTDINNFTQVFMSEKRSEFMLTINEFFVGVTHLVSRYNGSVYEFVGDEVLFYFKDEDHTSSSAIAISVLRDIHKLAQKINQKTEERGYTFKIKSSVAHGLLRFGPLVDAHALAGPPLIETVRMLSHVHEKSENTVLFDESMSEAVTDLCRSTKQQVVMLKGLKGARSLVTLEAFTPLSLHLRQADSKSLKNATYYRDDDDVVEILNFVQTNYGTVESGELNLLVSLFRQYTVAKATPEVRRAYVDCMNVLSHAHDHNEKDVYLYASLVSAANHILSQKEWAGEVRASMYGCLTHPNRRVVANSLDVFASFEPEAGDKIFSDLAKSGDNRIEANSLIKEAKRSWKKKTANWLKTMMKAPSPYSKASALYALGEIAKHFRETDEVAFASDAELQSLLEMVPKLCVHANAMVRRQALSAQAKSGRAQTAVATTDSNVTPLKKIG